MELGIDVVVHSATKFLSGHHDVMAGAIVGSREFVERAWKLHLVAGAVLSPFEAWLLLRGLRTLPLRVERHNRNALALARFLEDQPRVRRVNYPGLESHPQHELARAQMSGFTGMMSVELDGTSEEAERFLQSLQLGTYAASLGGFQTLVVHPAAMWAHALDAEQRGAMEVSDTLVRVSVGLEDERDLLADFEQALTRMRCTILRISRFGERPSPMQPSSAGIARMFQDMGELPTGMFEALRGESARWAANALASGEYLGWLGCEEVRPDSVVGGAGVQLRRVPPYPQKGSHGGVRIAKGNDAIVLNVFTEPEWRRRGLAVLLMREILAWARGAQLDRLVLHASAAARAMYEELGFVGTNEMRYAGDLAEAG